MTLFDRRTVGLADTVAAGGRCTVVEPAVPSLRADAVGVAELRTLLPDPTDPDPTDPVPAG